MAKFLLRNREYDPNIQGRDWDWKIVTENEMRELLNEFAFKTFANGYADVGVSLLRDEFAIPYSVAIRYTRNGWRIADLQENVFLREE